MRETETSAWFIKYGGPEFWQEFSERFYQKVLGNPALRKFFANTPEARVKEIAADMWQVILGFTGPMCAYAIEKKHAAMCVSDHEFDQYVILMKSTLSEIGVEEDDITEIEEKLSAIRPLVCGSRVT